MPINKLNYPVNWPSISIQVRQEANWICEWCQAPNAANIRRSRGADFEVVEKVAEEATNKMKWPRLKYHGLTRVVLSVAHLDRDSNNNDRANLAALCQRCHLNHDIHQHLRNRRYGRNHAQEHQLRLFV